MKLTNVEIDKARLTTWRKISLGTYDEPREGNIYGIYDFDITNLQEKIKNYNEKNPEDKITITHYFAKVITNTLKKHPQLNRILIRRNLYQRKEINGFFQIMIPGSKNLSGTTVNTLDNKSILQIAKELKDKVKNVKSEKDKELQRTQSTVSYIPAFFMKIFINLTTFLMYTLNLNAKFFGMKKDPFGGFMISNVGAMGIPSGIVPLVPFSKVPLIFSVGKIYKGVKVINDEIKIRKLLPIGVTMDHRVMDGLEASFLFEGMLRYLEEEVLPFDQI